MNTLTPHGALGLTLAAALYFALCAMASLLVVPLFARGWSLPRCVGFCAATWAKIFAIFVAAYVVLMFDTQNGDLSPAYLVPFLFAGGWLLSSELQRAGFAPKFPGVGVSSTGLILVGSGLVYAGLAF